MTIKVIEDGEDIVLTRSEMERLQREWEQSQRYTTEPQSFESWLRGQGYGRN